MPSPEELLSPPKTLSKKKDRNFQCLFVVFKKGLEIIFTIFARKVHLKGDVILMVPNIVRHCYDHMVVSNNTAKFFESQRFYR